MFDLFNKKKLQEKNIKINKQQVIIAENEEEIDFLKQYIKIIENLNNGEVKEIFKGETYLRLYLKTKLDYKIEIGTKFSNMKQERTYTLEELGL